MHEMPLRAPLPACATLFGFNTFSMNAAERMFDSGELISDLQFLNCRTGPGAAIEEAPATDHSNLNRQRRIYLKAEKMKNRSRREKRKIFILSFFCGARRTTRALDICCSSLPATTLRTNIT
jgi:hypothetical protein